MRENILCIIPARGGSKRIPLKNLRLLGGIPLMAHSIQQAKESRLIKKAVVSTDDAEIAEVSKKFGAEVVIRPEEISHDHATSESALQHAVAEVEKTGFAPTLVVFLQPTSPIRSPEDIDQAIQLLQRENADSLFSACRNDRFLWRKIGGEMQSLNYDYRKRHRDQDHPVEYRENGSIYVFRPDILEKYNNRLGGKIVVYEMDYWSSFQIDSAQHHQICEWILKMKKKNHDLQKLPKKPRLVVSDFDGVMTDNRVFVSQDGTESVVCNRSDGWGLSLLREEGVLFVVLSTERNSVVEARCKKLEIPCFQGVDHKRSVLNDIVKKYNVPLESAIYIGNDMNDFECIRDAGCGIAVANSHPEILASADIHLLARGGEGAVREVCELVLEKLRRQS